MRYELEALPAGTLYFTFESRVEELASSLKARTLYFESVIQPIPSPLTDFTSMVISSPPLASKPYERYVGGAE